jgi:hypothetical protein
MGGLRLFVDIDALEMLNNPASVIFADEDSCIVEMIFVGPIGCPEIAGWLCRADGVSLPECLSGANFHPIEVVYVSFDVFRVLRHYLGLLFIWIIGNLLRRL